MITDITIPKLTFPSHSDHSITAKRKDVIPLTATQGMGIISVTGIPVEMLKVGDIVVFGDDNIAPRRSTLAFVGIPNSNGVSGVLVNRIVERYIPTGNDPLTLSNPFLNFRKRWFMELRYLDINGGEIEGLRTRVPSNNNGDIRVDITLPKVLLKASILATTGYNSDLVTSFKVQYREIYEGNEVPEWQNLQGDPLFQIYLATEDMDGCGIIKLFNRKYPIYANELVSNVYYSNVRTLYYDVSQQQIGSRLDDLSSESSESAENLDLIRILQIVITAPHPDNAVFAEITPLLPT